MEAVKSAHRVLTILELLTAREGPMTFTELREALELPRSSLHSLLITMSESGWLRFDEATRSYTLGIRTLEAGNAYTRSLTLRARAWPYMTAVRDQLNETVQLAVLDGRHNVYIAKADGVQALRLASEVGRRLPAHATGLGKAMLAYLPADVLDELFAGIQLERYTSKTLPSLDALKAALERIRAVGYAADNEEYSIGVRCIAVPIRDHTGAVVAAMSVSAPTIRFDRDARRQAIDLLLPASRDLSRELGYDMDFSAAQYS